MSGAVVPCREPPQWRRVLCALSPLLPAPAQRSHGGFSALRVRSEQLQSAARKNDFGLPVCLAQRERGACNLPGKVAFLKMSTVRCCPQNTRPALKDQPVAMKLLSLGVMVRGGRGLHPPQPAALLAFNCAILQMTFLPQLASLPVCMSLAQKGVTDG